MSKITTMKAIFLAFAMPLSLSAQTAVTTSGGTTNAVPVFSGSSTLGNSSISISGSYVGIGQSSPLAPLNVSGQVVIGTPYRGDAALHINQAYGCCGRLIQESPSGISQDALNLTGSIDGSGIGQWFSWGVTGGKWNIYPGPYGFGPGFTMDSSANIGIGTMSPSAKLEINGSIKLSTNSGSSITFPDSTVQSTAWTGTLYGGDYAESVNITGNRSDYEPGDVLVISGNGSTTDVAKSSRRYSTLVGGIYSMKPGLIGRRQKGEKSDREIPMAMVGIVPIKVSTENGPIKRGDLLVTSSKPGYAMKGTDSRRMIGAVIGKALGNLDSGMSVIEVLVALQ